MNRHLIYVEPEMEIAPAPGPEGLGGGLNRKTRKSTRIGVTGIGVGGDQRPVFEQTDHGMAAAIVLDLTEGHIARLPRLGRAGPEGRARTAVGIDANPGGERGASTHHAGVVTARRRRLHPDRDLFVQATRKGPNGNLAPLVVRPRSRAVGREAIRSTDDGIRDGVAGKFAVDEAAAIAAGPHAIGKGILVRPGKGIGGEGTPVGGRLRHDGRIGAENARGIPSPDSITVTDAGRDRKSVV